MNFCVGPPKGEIPKICPLPGLRRFGSLPLSGEVSRRMAARRGSPAFGLRYLSPTASRSPAQVAITDYSPLWLQTTHRVVCFTRRADKGSLPSLHPPPSPHHLDSLPSCIGRFPSVIDHGRWAAVGGSEGLSYHTHRPLPPKLPSPGNTPHLLFPPIRATVYPSLLKQRMDPPWQNPIVG